jgi:exosortase A-associated hydrolase 2
LSSRQAFFLPAGDGQRFCIFTPAQGAAEKGAILYLHPFAEELNKSRHLIAQQIRLLATAGYSTLQIDLKGCGDSSHDFGDASWGDWLEDVRLAIAWLQAQTKAPLWLWGLRAGALLAAEAGRHLGLACNFLFWQPATSGEVALQQFLRLAAAAEWLGNEGRGAVERCKADLDSGKSVEIAGYRVSAELAAVLAVATLAPPGQVGRVVWLDVSNSENSPIFRSIVATLAQWQQSGVATNHRQIGGPAFWQTAEIVSLPELLAATCEMLG